MIISRAPVRISIGGGGTDLPFYCERKGGYLVTAAIDKYIYVFVTPRKFGKKFKITYMQNEFAEGVDKIKNDRVRETLKLLGLTETPLEIVTIGEVPSKSGLGSSSSFTVALLLALYRLKGMIVSKRKLAEDAYLIERKKLGIELGKQDQYAASFGGIIELKISKSGNVRVSPLNISFETVRMLEERLVLFYTGIKRDASQVLSEIKKTVESRKERIRYLDKIKDIGKKAKKYLEKGKLDKYGKLLHLHWELKKKYFPQVTNEWLEKIYETAIQSGSYGGKLIGAGRGGFFLFYISPSLREKFCKKMREMGLKELSFRFDFEGAKVWEVN